MSETFTLLIWEEVPETTKLFLVPNDAIDGDARSTLRTAHGHYINHSDATPEVLAALDCINNALCGNPEHLSEDHPVGSTWGMRWAGYEHKDAGPIEGKEFTAAYRCGFLL